MLGFLRSHGSLLPMIVMFAFVGIAALVTVYVLTDRRRGHLRRMAAMPLDDGQPLAGAETRHD